MEMDEERSCVCGEGYFIDIGDLIPKLKPVSGSEIESVYW
jgi:hypothetical protein